MTSKLIIEVFTIMALIIISSINYCSLTNAKHLDSYHFENVKVLIIGRCRSIESDGQWIYWYYRGAMNECAVYVYHTWLERIKIIIYNESISHPLCVLSNVTDKAIQLHYVNGTFFYETFHQFAARKIPPIVFVHCTAWSVDIIDNPSH